MVRQKTTQTARNMTGSSSAMAAVRREIAPATSDPHTSTRHNKKHRGGTILALIAMAASNGDLAGGSQRLCSK